MRIAALLSGGVDSSVALCRLRAEAEATVTAYYLKIWLEDELSHIGACPWEDDLAHARAVCGQLDVPLRVVSLQEQYYDRVVSYALAELRAGRTPSPDIFCNLRVKFGAFWDRVQHDAALIATGHYARIRYQGGYYRLLTAPDPVKDQTYFLSHLTQQQLARARFPIGDLTKRQVRALARQWNLPNRARKDSQGICFLGSIRYPEFVRHYLGERRGEIVERETGRVLGEHRGYWFYTIGQRQGLGLGNGPWYVVAKGIERNRIVVTHADNAVQSMRDRFDITDLTWIAEPADAAQPLSVKLRHGPQRVAARICRAGTDRLTVKLAEPDRGVAAGQFAVFYDGDYCLGGGRIAEGAHG
ncbi:MAG: tRNA 2-thiouridine(34) synthase MnmA [Spirochaetaceae bacterium]|nr:MAG: tRNA 2-thiouridine(34) synthase MnmA [Spirochaetaceae bacterium]